MRARAVNPSQDIYLALQGAYTHFNAALFGSELPDCVFTLQRRGRMRTFVFPERWHEKGDKIRHEIALNPAFFAEQTLGDFLSAVVREQCTVWQYCFGLHPPCRPNYQNREWAEKMRSIGLIASDTGKPGGKETGQNILHYVEHGGKFEAACLVLIEKGFSIPSLDRNFFLSGWPPEKIDGGVAGTPEGKMAQKLRAGFPAMTHWLNSAPRDKNKIKYTCQGCLANVWGKPLLSIRCAGCDRLFVEAESEGELEVEDQEVLY